MRVVEVYCPETVLDVEFPLLYIIALQAGLGNFYPLSLFLFCFVIPYGCGAFSYLIPSNIRSKIVVPSLI